MFSNALDNNNRIIIIARYFRWMSFLKYKAHFAFSKHQNRQEFLKSDGTYILKYPEFVSQINLVLISFSEI